MNVEAVTRNLLPKTVVAFSFNGEPITVLRLGYATVYEFTDFKLIETRSNDVTYLDDVGQVAKVGKDSYFYHCAMERVKRSNLLYESTLNLMLN